MPCHVNLPLHWIYEQPAWVDWFTNGRIAPELGLDAHALALPDSWHKAMAARFREAGLSCAVHLPFFGVDPGDADDARAEAARGALRRGAELAAVYGAAHMIGHPYFRPPVPGRQRDAIHGPWMEKALLAWPDLPRLGGAPLFLENTYETSPAAIAALVAALQREGAPGRAVGVCFDVGHWRSFAGCRKAEEFDGWLDAYTGFALHLHLHDNDGTADQHGGLGTGTVPLVALFERLRHRGISVTATLEPHDVAAFTASIRWLDAHNDVAARLGWERPCVEALPLGEIEKNLAM